MAALCRPGGPAPPKNQLAPHPNSREDLFHSEVCSIQQTLIQTGQKLKQDMLKPAATKQQTAAASQGGAGLSALQ